MEKLIEAYSDDLVTRSCGHRAEDLFCNGLALRGFQPRAKKVRSYKGVAWEESGPFRAHSRWPSMAQLRGFRPCSPSRLRPACRIRSKRLRSPPTLLYRYCPFALSIAHAIPSDFCSFNRNGRRVLSQGEYGNQQKPCHRGGGGLL